MMYPVSRRRAIQTVLMGGMLCSPLGALAAPATGAPYGPNPMYPNGFLKVLGFFDGADKDWYESVHAPDFVSYAAPYMARYARNWVEAVEAGATPPFRVITEIQYKNDNAKDKVRELQDSPAGALLLQHTMSHRNATGASKAPVPVAQLGLFPVSPHSVTRSALADPAATVHRRILLLHRSDDAGQGAFEAAALALGRDIAKLAPGIAVSLDAFARGPQAAPADAVMYVEGSKAAALPISGHKLFQVTSVLSVETRKSIG